MPPACHSSPPRNPRHHHALETRSRPMLRCLALAAALLLSAVSARASTLDTVRQNGLISCGVNVGLGGFSMPDSHGVWRGLDVDVCRAIAAAVLGDANK